MVATILLTLVVCDFPYNAYNKPLHYITARLYIFTMHGTLSYRCRVNGRVRVVSSMEPPNALLCVEGVNPCGIPSKLPEALPVPFFVAFVVP